MAKEKKVTKKIGAATQGNKPSKNAGAQEKLSGKIRGNMQNGIKIGSAVKKGKK